MPIRKHEQSGLETRILLTLLQSLRRTWNHLRGKTDYAEHGDPAAIVEMYVKYGPLKVLVHPKPGEDWFPLGRVLCGFEVEEARFGDGPDPFGGEIVGFSMDVKWKYDRPIRTGLVRWLKGP